MAGGYVPFLFLSRTGDISFIAPIMTLHTLFPTVYGFCTGESVTVAKVLGILGSFAAVGVLGADSMTGSGPDSVATLLTQLGLLGASTVCWGSAEIIAVRFGRLVRHKHAVLSQLVGVGIVAAVCCAALVAHALLGDPAPIAPAAPPDVGGVFRGISALWLSVVVLLGHAMASLGWMLYVRLGQLGDASQFAPVVQMYGIVTALLGIALAGEQVSAYKGIGMAVSAVAIALLGVSDARLVALLRWVGCRPAAGRPVRGPAAGDPYTALAVVPQGRSGGAGWALGGSSPHASDPGTSLVVASSAGSLAGRSQLRARQPMRVLSSAGSAVHSQTGLLKGRRAVPSRGADLGAAGPRSVSFASEAGAADCKATLGFGPDPVDAGASSAGGAVWRESALGPGTADPRAPGGAFPGGAFPGGAFPGGAFPGVTQRAGTQEDDPGVQAAGAESGAAEAAGSVASEPIPDVTATEAAQPAGPGLLEPSPGIAGESERAASVGAPEGVAERQEAGMGAEQAAGRDELAGVVAVGGAERCLADQARPGPQAPILAVGGPSAVPQVVTNSAAGGELRAEPPLTGAIPQGPFSAHTEFVAAISDARD